jgi:hypothetical protein
VTCAVYAREHGLLEEEGWKWFKGIVKREKKMLCMVNQSRIKQGDSQCTKVQVRLSYPSKLQWGNAIWPKEW